MEKIELLDISLLSDDTKLKEIDHWLKVLNWTNGWHYDLDVVWLLKCIERFKISPGATILDAGAGLGVTQFILASRGFNVISLDFNKRGIPKYSKGIFSIDSKQNDLQGDQHEYMDWMTYGQRKSIKMKTDGKNNKFSKHMNTALIDPMRIAYIIKNRLLELYNPYYQAELGKSHEKFGKITFLRGAFNDIPLEGNKIDLIVSISAFEHNNYDDMPNSIVEFLRVLKKNASMIITTSAAHEKDWYHTPSKGWNLTLQTLSKWFGIADNHSFDYESTSNRIKNCEKLKKRIPDYYKYTAESGLPYADLKNAEYIPVGVIKRKAVLT